MTAAMCDAMFACAFAFIFGPTPLPPKPGGRSHAR